MAIKKTIFFMLSEVTLYHRLTFKIAIIILCKYKTMDFVRECFVEIFFSLVYNSVELIKNLSELIFPFVTF